MSDQTTDKPDPVTAAILALRQGHTQEALDILDASSNPLVIKFDREVDGRWIAEILAMPGVMAYGNSKREAFINASCIAADVLLHESSPESTTELTPLELAVAKCAELATQVRKLEAAIRGAKIAIARDGDIDAAMRILIRTGVPNG